MFKFNNGLVVVLATIVILFLASVARGTLRHQNFATIASGFYEDQSARTLKFARNWYSDGLITSKFVMFENPSSVEFSKPQDRLPYLSFPPGAVLSYYFFTRVFSEYPSLKNLQFFNLLNQLLISVLLAMGAYYLLNHRRERERFVFSFFVGVFYIFWSPLSYWHQHIYFHDQALVLPLVGFWLCEMLRIFGAKEERHILFISAFFLFYLAFVDWIAFVVLFLWVLVRIAINRTNGKKVIESCFGFYKELILFVLCLLVPYLLLVYQVFNLEMIYFIKNRFISRTVIESDLWKSRIEGISKFIFTHNFTALGIGPVVLFISSLFLPGVLLLWNVFTKKKISKTGLMLIFTLAILFYVPFLHMLIVPSHYEVHPYSVHKFLPYYILFFSLILYRLIFSLWNTHGCYYLFRVTLYSLCAVSSLVFLNNNYSFYKLRGPILKQSSSLEKLREKLSYDDVVYSFDTDFPVKLPTQELSLSMKRVHRVKSFEQILDYEFDDTLRQEMLPAMYQPQKNTFNYKAAKRIFLFISNPAKCSNDLLRLKKIAYNPNSLWFDKNDFFGVIQIDVLKARRYSTRVPCQKNISKS